MKKIEVIQMEKTLGGDGNCQGIYGACVSAAACVGIALILTTGGLGSIAGVLVGGSGMELCRQQFIGCR